MNRIEHLLSCLSEECAEVSQRASKALRFGLTEVQPGQDLDNAARIGVELQDVFTIVEMLVEAGALDVRRDPTAVRIKKKKVEKFMAYARECGTLDKETAR